jgi:signal peptidase II
MPLGTYDSPGRIEVIPGFFNLVHVVNTGAAWSILAGRGPLLSLLAVAALAAIFFLRRAIELRRPVTQIAFGLLCGGIAGNLADRIARGHVIDFFDFHFGNYAYPAFNIADSGICVGVAMYVLITFLTRAPTPPAR